MKIDCQQPLWDSRPGVPIPGRPAKTIVCDRAADHGLQAPLYSHSRFAQSSIRRPDRWFSGCRRNLLLRGRDSRSSGVLGVPNHSVGRARKDRRPDPLLPKSSPSRPKRSVRASPTSLSAIGGSQQASGRNQNAAAEPHGALRSLLRRPCAAHKPPGPVWHPRRTIRAPLALTRQPGGPPGCPKPRPVIIHATFESGRRSGHPRLHKRSRPRIAGHFWRRYTGSKRWRPTPPSGVWETIPWVRVLRATMSTSGSPHIR